MSLAAFSTVVTCKLQTRTRETGQRVVWSWIKEEELTLSRCESKGFTGYLSLPREAFLMTKHGVIRALRTPLHEIPSLKLSVGRNGTSTVQTLGIRPLPNLSTLRKGKPRVWKDIPGGKDIGRLASSASSSWELEAVIHVQDQRRVGFHIRYDEIMSQRTSIWFLPESEEISVDRSRSNSEADIKKDNLSGPFTLFVSDDPGAEVTERLHIRIFVDGDVLEIFANDRFALSTVVYAGTRSCAGISWHVDGNHSDEVVFKSISLWDQLASVQ